MYGFCKNPACGMRIHGWWNKVPLPEEIEYCEKCLPKYTFFKTKLLESTPMITEEEMDEVFAEQQHVADSLGMVSYEHFLTFKYNAVEGMRKFGDLFTRTLGMALMRASTSDAVKIIRVWQNVISQHEMLYKIYVAKELALKKAADPID